MRAHAELVILPLLACAGILYLMSKLLTAPGFNPQDHIDFQDLWLAGKLWASGRNPYDGAFFPNAEHLSTWFYPPYWYPLVVPFGLLPYEVALGLWKIINFLLLIGATYLGARTIADLVQQKWLPLFCAGTTYVCFMHAGPLALWVGQTSIIVYFGISVLFFGILKARPSMLVIGLLLLALKPQIGVVAFAAVAALRSHRWVIAPAGAICLLSTGAIAITANYRESIEGFLVNLARHSEHSANRPPYQTGLIHILDYIQPVSGGLPVTLLTTSAAVVCAVIAFYALPIDRIKKMANAAQTVSSLALFVATTFFILPLHYYDMISLAVLLMIIVALPLQGRWLIAIGLFLCFRPDYIGRAFGIAPSAEIFKSDLTSVGLLMLVLGAVWSLLASRSDAELRPGVS